MILLVVAFIAGLLTILAPCVLPLLPIIVGRSVGGQEKYKPVIVSASLAVSVVLFTLLLKSSTVFINIPQSAWSYISGTIIIFFGLITVFPELWEKISFKLNFNNKSNQILGQSAQKKGFVGDILVGAALGPVFSSCSPTYFLILATVLPQSFAKGLLYLIAYAFGLSLMLLLIGYIGQRFVKKLASFADPKGKFKKTLGIIFLIVGIAIFIGFDKKVETAILNSGFYDITSVEQKLLTNPMENKIQSDGVTVNKDGANTMSKASLYPKYKELVNPSGFVNSEPFKLADIVGKKVVLSDFWTYSCINCQRTLPYMRAWYEKYKVQGLEIVGIHTPEFAFEKLYDNVVKAAGEFGLTYPIVQDNDYSIWNAYGNQFWPRKYLIDVDGYIVYDHIGEGGYAETEKAIQKALQELHDRQNMTSKIDTSISQVQADIAHAQSPETYFGSNRNTYLANGTQGKSGLFDYTLPNSFVTDELYLGGKWQIDEEYATTASENSKIVFKYKASKVFIVASADKDSQLEIRRDGQLVTDNAGKDVVNGIVIVKDSKLYNLIDEKSGESEHTLEIIVKTPGVRIYTFTFG